MAIHGRVVGVSVNEQRGVSKRRVGAADIQTDRGLVGDGHAGEPIKQVSFLAIESINRICGPVGVNAGPGDFAENITTEGLDLLSIPVGSRLRMGNVLLEVTQHGKRIGPEHTFNFHGLCILPDEGMFCRVLEGGRVSEGDPIELLK